MSNCLFLSVSFLTTLPAPPIIPVNNAPSVPNLTLFNSSLVGSSSVDLSIAVGPPTKSPNVPSCSTSPTNTELSLVQKVHYLQELLVVQVKLLKNLQIEINNSM